MAIIEHDLVIGADENHCPHCGEELITLENGEKVCCNDYQQCAELIIRKNMLADKMLPKSNICPICGGAFDAYCEFCIKPIALNLLENKLLDVFDLLITKARSFPDYSIEELKKESLEWLK